MLRSASYFRIPTLALVVWGLLGTWSGQAQIAPSAVAKVENKYRSMGLIPERSPISIFSAKDPGVDPSRTYMNAESLPGQIKGRFFKGLRYKLHVIGDQKLKDLEMKIYTLEGRPLKPKLLASQKAQGPVVEYDTQVVAASMNISIEVRSSQAGAQAPGMAIYVAVDPAAMGTAN